MFEREENPRSIKQADVVVGLASYNEADCIRFPTKQASLGLKKYYSGKTSAVVNCDNASMDGTEEVFLETETYIPKIYVTTPPHTPGKGFNFENMFRKIIELDSKALVCLDADLLSVTPEWVKYFADAVLDGYDFVTPIYSRHKYDGTITNNICFPIVYGLFCKNIRQPIGGDFGLSQQLARHLVCQRWHSTTQEYGVDIFMTMNAIIGGFKICNVGLGAKIHKPSAPKLGPMFVQVVSTAFLTVLREFDNWKNISVIDDLDMFGLKDLDPPQDLVVDRDAIERQSREGFTMYQGELEKDLSPDLYKEMTKAFEGSGAVDISSEQWITAVYDMIVAFKSSSNKSTLVKALKGLYFGRTFSFMNETWDYDAQEAEEVIQKQAKLFFKKRDYLIKKLEDQQ